MAIVGAVVGFFIMGIIAYVLVRFALALALGGISFFLARAIFPNTAIALVAALIGLVLGIVMFNKLLSVATALAGGLMVAYALNALQVSSLIALAGGVLIILVGIVVQSKQPEKKENRNGSDNLSGEL